MKLIAIAAASLMLMAGAANAQMSMQSSAPGLYGEVGYTGLKITGAAQDVQPGVLRGILGFNFGPYLAAEGMLGFGVTKDDKEATVNGQRVTIQGDVEHMYGAYIAPKAMLGPQFELFGRFGWTETRLKAKAGSGVFTGSNSRTGGDWSYGLGGNFHFNPRMYVGLDYMQYYNKNSTKLEGVTLGLGYRF